MQINMLYTYGWLLYDYTLKFTQYSNPSVYEQSVYEFSLIQDAQINPCFSIYKPIFTYMISFLSQTNRYSCREVTGN
jgi:hypothetical protein